ncbi:uncharacterized protein BCR38DRAFT_43462 [Pseudomassariella vexata]|uniref:Uncharacterized protein n=1 Tax=Pseudomassariella vexata TaxID=1141098 RepID=A0A1Y2DMY4_9PEZI|nr:uncharacterized protein BCR38DRAFT_43462 [Pseudomassariella vexata]ORY60632.1 hypothetical protein BCR38DRAFT_43462 [Pseudomassariella vexata]
MFAAGHSRPASQCTGNDSGNTSTKLSPSVTLAAWSGCCRRWTGSIMILGTIVLYSESRCIQSTPDRVRCMTTDMETSSETTQTPRVRATPVAQPFRGRGPGKSVVGRVSMKLGERIMCAKQCPFALRRGTTLPDALDFQGGIIGDIKLCLPACTIFLNDVALVCGLPRRLVASQGPPFPTLRLLLQPNSFTDYRLLPSFYGQPKRQGEPH